MRLMQFVNPFVIVTCLLMFLLGAYLDVANGFGGLAVVTLAMLAAFYPYMTSSLGVISLFTGVTLFTVPTYALIFVGAGVSPAWFALYVICALAIILLAGPDPSLPEPDRPYRGDLAAIAVILALGLLSQTAGLFEHFFHAAWEISIVHLERLHRATSSIVKRMTGTVMILAAVLVYALLYWQGYGRLILASFALGPIMLAVHYRSFRLNVFAFSALAASLLFVGRVIRFGWSDGVAGLADDSGASPLTLTQGLWQGSSQILNGEPYWHQWSLLFLQWCPRVLWPDKPIGLNYSFVDNFLGRQGLGEEHSTAIGYFGEHIFIAGDAWLLSTLALTGVIIVLLRIVRRLSHSYATPGIIYAAWLLTLFWGGMADFGSRVWLSLVPALLYVQLLRLFSGRAAPPDGMPLDAHAGLAG